MTGPHVRPMHTLPTLEPHRAALETCVYCPKLCRSACPVSNAEPRETVTPWGKMSMAYFSARGDVPMTNSFAQPAWACTGCYACRESCDHRNDVASTLLAARAALLGRGVAPPAAVQTIARFAAHDRATGHAVRELAKHSAVRADAPHALLVGCAYARAAASEARDAIGAASALVDGPVALVDTCCGLPLLYAGDEGGFVRQAQRLADRAARYSTLLVVDAGCAMALRVWYPRVAVTPSPAVELLVERAARDLARLNPVPLVPPAEAVRYHDPCQLGRGLGIYAAPRAVLTRILGRAPDEFIARQERATCSGAGALLPRTMQQTSRAITKSRREEHARLGGGRVVTACASSLLAFRRAGLAADDLVTWIARATPEWTGPTRTRPEQP